ncbi:MAG: hypothetical protein RI945_91 [Candidatus Parcubacteria bacterium]|jgi:hypothetical protein
MKILKQNIIVILKVVILVFLLIFCIFFDLALSTTNFPVLTTIFFSIFILLRFLSPVLR